MNGTKKLELFLLISNLTAWGCAVYGAFTPVDNYLIDCGSSANTTIGSRTFVADKPAAWSITDPQNSMLASTNSTALTANDSALYLTARIFTGTASYSIPIQSPGRHWIRLYFFPFSFRGIDLTGANFSVTALGLGLFSNSRGLNLSAVPSFKEYWVNINANSLVLSFLPSGNSIAFVNAIEVVSAPDRLFHSAQLLDSPAQNQNIQGLQTLHRINMGNKIVLSTEDSLTRTWQPDGKFLTNINLAQFVSTNLDQVKYQAGGPTQETAPASVYATATAMANPQVNGKPNFNVTWEFTVDAGFLYLVRLHFCNIVSNERNNLFFNVYINSQAAALNLELDSLSRDSISTAQIIDRIAAVDSDGPAKLRISIGISQTSPISNGTLNGLEIMKLSNSDGGFDGQAPSRSSKSKSIALVLGCVLGALGVVAMTALMWFVRRRKRGKVRAGFETWSTVVPTVMAGESPSTDGGLSTRSSGQRTNPAFCFPFSTLKEATNNFDENKVIGIGGFGKVYKGVLRDGNPVAVKRGNRRSQQGIKEFITEIELLSQLRHRHLVSLVGFCDQQNEMILVYEYMEKGTLRSHLYGSGLPALSWKQRLEICIGSASGLHYLHTGQAKAIIHRDVKSANILLDSQLTPKVADFGLSKTMHEVGQTHVSTAVKGSFGYLDPEYYRRRQLTEKSDVYSFGVVLLEVLCARPVIDHMLPREMVNLAEWGMALQREGRLLEAADSRIADTIRAEALRKFGETTEKCLAEDGVDRPSMGDVMWNLQYVLQLQEGSVSSFPGIESMNTGLEIAPRVKNIIRLESIAAEDLEGESENECSNATTNESRTPPGTSDVSETAVFSQLLRGEGR